MKRNLNILIPSAVALVTLFAFLPCLRGGFVNWDDTDYFLKNLNYRGLDWPHLRWMLSTCYRGIYMPVAWLSWAVDYKLWGMNPFGYHLANLLGHIANTLLLYGVALKLFSSERDPASRPRSEGVIISAGLAAALFALHPLRVESVAWVTERKDILASFFGLLSVLFYLRHAEAQKTNRRFFGWLGLSWICLAASLGSKPSTVPVPIIFILLDFYPLKRLGHSSSWIEKWPFFALAIPCGLLAILSQAHAGEMSRLLPQSLSQRLAVSVHSFIFYPSKTLLPIFLSPFYRMPEGISWTQPRFLLSGLMVGMVTLFLILNRRKWPAVLVAWCAYLAFAAPTSGLFHSGSQLAADRFSYLSCMPWAILAGAGLLSVWDQWKMKIISLQTMRALGGGCTAVVLVWAALTWKQCLVWTSSETLWQRVLAVDPNCGLAYTNIGNILLAKGDAPGGLSCFNQALVVQPGFPFALSNLGIWALTHNKTAVGEDYFRQAIRSNPGLAESYSNLGAALFYEGKKAEAEEAFQKATQLKSDYTDAFYNLGKLMLAEHKPNEAAENFKKALLLNPGYTAVHNSFADLLISQGNVQAAQAQYEEALVFAPESEILRQKLNTLRAR